MLKPRHLIRALAVLGLLASVVTLASSPVSAQDIVGFSFKNDEPTDSGWEFRISVESFGGCGEADGRGSRVSPWFEQRDKTGWAVVLDLRCTYTITASARNSTHSGKICKTVLAWGANVDGEDTNASTELSTKDDTRGTETTVAVEHKGGTSPICEYALRATFKLDAAEVVQDLPKNATDAALEARAERAVEVTDFAVRVGPDDSTKSNRGCNQVLTFNLRGGKDGQVEQDLPGIPTGGKCKFRATITSAPAPFAVLAKDGFLFETPSSTTTGAFTVNLSTLLSLPWGRISIVQDVTGSNNRGEASYKIDRSCAGVSALPPTIIGGGGPSIRTLPGGQVVATLSEGRFTVHSDNFANFGPGANYLAVASSITSTNVAGCSVQVTVISLPGGCSVAGGDTQSLTWASSKPFSNYDFEFDITCGGASTAPDSGLPPTPPGGTDSGSSGDATTAPVAAGADVRIIARKLANGKIEFGLEQRQDDESWGGRQLPRLRLFPTTASVGTWLVSSVIDVFVASSPDSFGESIVVRIIARKHANGKVEFGLQEQTDSGSWGRQLLPTRRYFPTDAGVNRWLASTSLSLVESTALALVSG